MHVGIDDHGRVWKKWEDEGLIEQQIRSHRDARGRYLDLIKKYSAKFMSPKLLEAGCGSAIDSYIMADETGAEVWGMDISEEALGVGERIGKYFMSNVRLVKGDVSKMALEDGAFDLVYSQGLLEHFERPVDILKEQVRVLKPGGVLIVNVPQKYTGYTVYKHLMALTGRWEWGSEAEFSSWQLEWYGQRLGLEFLERCGYDYWRSPFEPLFVLRTINTKAEKIPLVKKCPVHPTVSRFWDRMWSGMEEMWGHLFMKNIVYVYRKPE